MTETANPVIAVVGGGISTPQTAKLALEVGREVAARGAVLICGGRGGVMEHAAKGAWERAGVTLGVLPGRPDSDKPNPYLSYRLFTGLGQARNQIIVLSAAAVIAVGGEWGTLSEIALALKHRVPVVLLSSFDVRLPGNGDDPLLFRAGSAVEAARIALEQRRRFP